MFGVLQQFEIGRRRRLQRHMVGDRKGLERVSGAVGAEILRHGGLDILHGDGRAPAPQRRRDRCEGVRHEQIGLHQFDRRGPPRQRQHDIGQEVERQRPHDAVQQRRQIGAEQRLRTQRLDPERAVLQQQQPRRAGEQRIRPHRKADQHAAHGAARGGAPPQ